MKRSVVVLLSALLGIGGCFLLLNSAGEQAPVVDVADSVVDLPQSSSELPNDSVDAPEETERGEVQARAEAIDSSIAHGYMNPDYRDALIAADSDTAWRALWVEFYVIPNTSEPVSVPCQILEPQGGKRICWNDYGFHPYLALPIADLRTMGETDPAAADALSILLPTEAHDERMYYAIQAAHLSGKPGSLYRFARMMSSTATNHQRRLERYSLFRLGDSLETPLYRAREFEARLQRDLGLTNAELREAARETITDLFQRAKIARSSS